MAGQLTVDQLRASSGVLATQNGMTGIAKAWVTFTGSTAAINGSFNVSSVTRNAAGDYTISFTTSFASANIVMSGAIKIDETNQGRAGDMGYYRTTSNPTASSARISTSQDAGTNFDPTIVNAVFDGI